jgi:hypothetical protein
MFVSLKGSLNDKKVFAMVNILAVNRIKITFTKGQIIYGIQKICFAGTIRAYKTINTITERCLSL